MVGKIEDVFRRQPWKKGAAEARLAEHDEGDALTHLLVGNTCRLEVPLGSVYNLRRVATLLRDLAEQYDFLSRRDDIPPRSILFQARECARATNAAMRRMRRKKGEPE